MDIAVSATPVGGSDHVSMVVDVKQRRPACVLLQACFGCGDANGFLQSLFDPQTWLVSPTDDMRKVTGTKAQWRSFAEAANAAGKKNRRTPDGGA